MKIQDAVFFAIFLSLIVFKKPQWFVHAGLLSLAISIPLFAGWIFFTAQRLTWYAGAFFLSAIAYTQFFGKETV